MTATTLAALLARPGTRCVLLAGSRDPNAKMTLVLLDDYGPAFVAKVPTTRNAATVVQREGELLAAVRASGVGKLAATLPQPLGYVDVDGLPALLTNALTGTPMTVRYHGWRHTARQASVRSDFAAAGAWLAELQSRTARSEAPVTLLHEAIDIIGSRFPDYPSLPAVRRKLIFPADRLNRCATPRTVVHGDYWFGNLLMAGQRVAGVVDWEAGALTGEPLRDVVRFAASYALYLDRHTKVGRRVAGHPGLRADTWGAGLAHAATGRGWFGAVVRDYLATALDRLGLPTSLWPDLVLTGIADVAATADHPEFALAHLDLLTRMAAGTPQVEHRPAGASVQGARATTVGAMRDIKPGAT